MHISAAIEKITERVESHRAGTKLFGGQGYENPIVASTGGYNELAYGQQTTRYAEQYKHFVGWTFTAINRIATRIAGQPVHVGRKLGESTSMQVRRLTEKHGFNAVNAAWQEYRGKRLLSPVERAQCPAAVKSTDAEIEIIDNHPVLDAMADPNELMAASSLFWTTVSSFELTGRAYWWWAMVDGKLRIYPIPTHWVTPQHTQSELYKTYQIQPQSAAAFHRITVPAEHITAFVLPDPYNPHRSVSPAQTQAPAISADEAIQVSQARAFHNDLFPGLILHAGRLPGIDGKPGERPVLTAPQRKDLIEACRAVWEGAVNYHEPFIVDGLIEEVSRMTYAPQEMDYLKSGQSTKNRIMQAFGVNPFLAGENTTVGWGQASVAESTFLDNVVNPLAVLMSQSISRFALLNDQGYLFWIEESIARNPEHKLKSYMVGLNNKAGPMVSEEEFRRDILNLPPRKEGGGSVVYDEPPDEDEEGQGGVVDEDGDMDEVGEPPKKPVPERVHPLIAGRGSG